MSWNGPGKAQISILLGTTGIPNGIRNPTGCLKAALYIHFKVVEKFYL